MVRACATVTCCLALLLSVTALAAAGSEVADAAMKADKEALRSLLQKRADVNAPQPDGATALHWAVWRDDLEMTSLLLRAGAKANAANGQGATPLSLACVTGDAAIIAELLKAGADPNAPLSNYGDTALMLASRTGKPEAVKLLLDHGARVNAKETWGGTAALMWATSERHADVTAILIAHGADVNARSKIVPAPLARGDGKAAMDFLAPDAVILESGSAETLRSTPAGDCLPTGAGRADRAPAATPARPSSCRPRPR